jgi:tRNA threonylcarbamoyladenosine biosynthesis protein TsaB
MPNETFLLVLNSAEGVLQIVLGRDDPAGVVLAWSESVSAASQGAELLTPALARGLAAVGAAPARIRRIACVTGPGSFTGLRLASVTTAGLAAVTGALSAGLQLLPLLAASAAPALDPSDTTVGVLTHARRNLVHVQVFRMREGRLSPLTSIKVLDPASALQCIAAVDSRAVVLGSGLSRNPQTQVEAGLKVLGPEFEHPTPEILLRAAEALAFGPEPVVPFYVRPSDAEENLPALSASLGLDPAEAEAALRAFGVEAPDGEPS